MAKFGLAERRQELEAHVAIVLAALDSGTSTEITERAAIDFKEEAGRRSSSGELEPGERTNPAAAEKLADEVCCMANTPGGGALLLGVDDRTHDVLGTELDEEWLRHRIFQLCEIAPAIEVHHVAGQRLLALYVAESPEPVLDRQRRIRWRVGDHCVPVDRSEWWLRREQLGDVDPMAGPSSLTEVAVSAPVIETIRRSIAEIDEGREAQDNASPAELLQRIGALRADGTLTQAARLLLTPVGRTHITFSVHSVPGGDILAQTNPASNLSLLEQLTQVEQHLEAWNTTAVLPSGFAEQRVSQVPRRAVREAILNGLIHRDWNTIEQTSVLWIVADATLIVRSPGGFTGGISTENLLSARHSRYPALADLFRALKLVDKQGVGIDRMYTSMITLGHRPPYIIEDRGPAVICTLAGGAPVAPVVELVAAIQPAPRRSDVRIAVVLHELLYKPFVTLNDVQRILQADETSARTALRAATASTVGQKPLVKTHKDVWVLGDTAFNYAIAARRVTHEPDFLSYASTDRRMARGVVDQWLETHDDITTGDLKEMTAMSRPTAQQILQELEGSLLRAAGAGRTARFEKI